MRWTRIIGAGLIALILVTTTRAALMPHDYLAPDSFIYFTMARQVHDAGLLFSYTGVDHATGVHPLYYVLMSLVYPVAQTALPSWSLVLGSLFVVAGLLCLVRHLGWSAMIVATIIVFTPWGFSLSNNGVESALVFSSLALLAASLHSLSVATRLVDPLDSPRQSILLGLVLSVVMLARLDLVLFVAPLVAALILLEVRRRGESLRFCIRWALVVTMSSLILLAPTLALYYFFGGSILPASGELKSSFPMPQEGWFTVLLSLKVFIAALFAAGLYVAYYSPHRFFVGALGVGVFITWLYNGLFVANIGAWYGALPFYVLVYIASVLTQRIWVRWDTSSATVCVSVLVVLIVYTHTLGVKSDWITPHQEAAAVLASIHADGSAAAELKDGEVAFYSVLPVYSLTGLANNQEYYDAVHAGRVTEYLKGHKVMYIVGGTHGSGVQVPGGEHLFKNCTNSVFENEFVALYGVDDCAL